MPRRDWVWGYIEYARPETAKWRPRDAHPLKVRALWIWAFALRLKPNSQEQAL